jgi:hypothetical protein
MLGPIGVAGVAFMLLGVLLTIVLVALSVARSEPQQQVGADITELPEEARGKWCIDTEYPKGGTLYKRCDNAKGPAISISAKIIVAQTGAKCAFNNGMIAGTALSAANAASRQPLYLIEVACPAVGNLIYWMWRDNDLLNVKPFHREDLPSGGKQ